MGIRALVLKANRTLAESGGLCAGTGIVNEARSQRRYFSSVSPFSKKLTGGLVNQARHRREESMTSCGIEICIQ